MEEWPPHRKEVDALFGRCLMRLQQYEVLMKQLIARHSLTSTASGVSPTDPKLAKLLGISPLGIVAQQFFETYLVSQQRVEQESKGAADEGPTLSEFTEVRITTTVRMEMSAEDYEATKKSVADLVELRNTLAHHFLELFDVWSEAGCAEAVKYLTTSCERIGRDLEQLQGWAKSMIENQRRAAALFNADVVRDFVINGIVPDEDVDW